MPSAPAEPSAFPHGPTARRLAPSADLPAGVVCEVLLPGQPGMTLRDFFAAAVVSSLAMRMLDGMGHGSTRGMVGTAYLIADEMLAFRAAVA